MGLSIVQIFIYKDDDTRTLLVNRTGTNFSDRTN